MSKYLVTRINEDEWVNKDVTRTSKLIRAGTCNSISTWGSQRQWVWVVRTSRERELKHERVYVNSIQHYTLRCSTLKVDSNAHAHCQKSHRRFWLTDEECAG